MRALGQPLTRVYCVCTWQNHVGCRGRAPQQSLHAISYSTGELQVVSESPCGEPEGEVVKAGAAHLASYIAAADAAVAEASAVEAAAAAPGG